MLTFGARRTTLISEGFSVPQKSTRSALPSKNERKESAIFESALRRVLAVSKSDLDRMLDAEKRANAGKPKRGPKPKHS